MPYIIDRNEPHDLSETEIKKRKWAYYTCPKCRNEFKSDIEFRTLFCKCNTEVARDDNPKERW